MDYSLNHLRKYFIEHPAIDVQRIEKICKIPEGTVRHFVKERRGLPNKHFNTLERELLNYGYDPLIN